MVNPDGACPFFIEPISSCIVLIDERKTLAGTSDIGTDTGGFGSIDVAAGADVLAGNVAELGRIVLGGVAEGGAILLG